MDSIEQQFERSQVREDIQAIGQNLQNIESGIHEKLRKLQHASDVDSLIRSSESQIGKVLAMQAQLDANCRQSNLVIQNMQEECKDRLESVAATTTGLEQLTQEA